jgi:hypothetical protein
MKKLIALALLCLVAAALHAQTYANFKLTSFPYSAGYYVCSTNVAVPTNTIARIINFEFTSGIVGGVVTVQYAGQPAMTFPDSSQWLNFPIMGPCTVTVTASSSSATGNFVVVLTQFDTVNTTPFLQGYAVQPNGHTASVALEASTNLTTWTATTNGTYAATNKAQFYRLSMTVN